jgi:hypothetical protein
MRRVRLKNGARAKLSPSEAPNFYNMEPCLEDSGLYNELTVQDPVIFHQNDSFRCDKLVRVTDPENFFSADTETDPTATNGMSATSTDSAKSCETATPTSLAAFAVSSTSSDGSTSIPQPRLCGSSEGHDGECMFETGEAMMFEGKRFYFLDIEGLNGAKAENVLSRDHHHGYEQ